MAIKSAEDVAQDVAETIKGIKTVVQSLQWEIKELQSQGGVVGAEFKEQERALEEELANLESKIQTTNDIKTECNRVADIMKKGLADILSLAESGVIRD